ncbi:hypothetical protein Tco_1550546, partial [Tanacetum coccineum]
VSKTDFKSYAKANDANMNNLQMKLDNFQRNQNDFQRVYNDSQKKQDDFQKMMLSFMQSYHTNQPSSSSTLPSNTIPRVNVRILYVLSDTLDPLSQKLENKNIELEFQVRNYEKENAHLKTTYKNLFDSILVTRAQTKTIIDTLQDKLHDTIYENAKLRAQLFDRTSEQKDFTKGTSVNTQFKKQSIMGKPPSSSGSKLYSVTPFPKSKGLPKINETHALSKPVTSNSVLTPQESKVMKNDNVIAQECLRLILLILLG